MVLPGFLMRALERVTGPAVGQKALSTVKLVRSCEPCLCVSPPVSEVSTRCKLIQFPLGFKQRQGPGRMHRRLVNEAGDVSGDMEMGCYFHVPAENFCLRCDSTLPFWFHGGSACYIPQTGFYARR